jgi:beta-1,4-N-acetylglucosaminyltransferase
MLKPVYEQYDYFYVLNDRALLAKDMDGKTYFIRHSERDWVFFVNLWEAWHILRKEQPRLVLSTGAGPIVPFAILGKLLSIPTLFIETFTRVTTPSLTGRIMYWLADRFFYQWKPLTRFFPKGTYGGPLV